MESGACQSRNVNRSGYFTPLVGALLAVLE